MLRLLSLLGGIAAIAALLSFSFAPQGPGRKIILKNGPYKVVMSKPLTQRGWKGGTLYTEHEELTKFYNQLAIDNLTPLYSNVITDYANQDASGAIQERLLVVCRRP